MMKKQIYKAMAALILSVSSLFVLMGSYFYINKPEIPDELKSLAK